MDNSDNHMDYTIMHEKFITHHNDSSDDPVNIVLAGISHCDGSYRIQRTCSTIYVMEAIAEGQGTLDVNGRRFYPKAGDCYLIPIHSNHYYFSDPKDPWVKYWFNVNGNAFDAFVRACGIQDVILFPQCHLANAFKQALEDLDGKGHEEMTDLGAGYVLRLVRLLQKAYRRQQSQDHPIPPEAQELKDFLERHVCTPPPSLKQLCQICNCSEAQMRRLFKQAFNTSPMAYLIDAKLRLAKNMLESSDIPVKELSGILGFTDPFYFSRLFKARVGLSPAQFHQANFPCAVTSTLNSLKPRE